MMGKLSPIVGVPKLNVLQCTIFILGMTNRNLNIRDISQLLKEANLSCGKETSVVSQNEKHDW